MSYNKKCKVMKNKRHCITGYTKELSEKLREVDKIYGIKPFDAKAKPEERICARIIRQYKLSM